MKLKRIVLGLSVVVVTLLACEKEASLEPVTPPVTLPNSDSTIAATPDSTTTGTPDSTIISAPTDTTAAPVITDTTKVPAPTDTVATQPPAPVDTIKTTPPPPPPPQTDTTSVPPPPVQTDTTQTVPPTQPDTTQTTTPVPQLTAIKLRNSGFEQWFYGWTKETTYTGKYGFTVISGAATSGLRGLNFYAAQKTHWVGAPQETPWNGRVYQTVSGLADGTYIFKASADAVGDGMYLYADGGAGIAKVLIKSEVNEVNSLEFEVKGGVARIGFICIDAGGTQKYAPYFHADDVKLFKK